MTEFRAGMRVNTPKGPGTIDSHNFDSGALVYMDSPPGHQRFALEDISERVGKSNAVGDGLVARLVREKQIERELYAQRGQRMSGFGGLGLRVVVSDGEIIAERQRRDAGGGLAEAA